MKNRFLTLSLACVMGGSVVMALAPSADAQRARRDAPEEAPVAEGRQFGAEAGEKVNAALQDMNANNNGAAVAKLNEALALPDLNPYEKATIHQMMGSAYYEQNQYARAIQSFESSISSGGLLPAEATSLRLNIAQLLIANGRHVEGATMLENYINQGNPVKPAYVDMLVGAWVQAENYNKALPWAERWFREASPKERKHFDLLNFLYNNLGMKGKQSDIVLQMINRYPGDRTLWDTLASMMQEGGREQDAFEINKMLYLGGAMKSEQDVMKIVQYYSFYEMPFQAAKILEREMNAGVVPRTTDRLVLLSDLLRQAREYKRAIPILESAAQQAGSSKVYAQLGEALKNESQCGKAETAFRKAIDLGYNRGKAWSYIATCIYESSQDEERISCDWSEQRKASAPRKILRDKAYAAFGNVPSGTRDGSDAAKWRQFIKAEERQIADRCEFELNVEKEQCFGAIENAYNSKFLNEGKVVIDEKCQPFKAEFDRLYRTSAKKEG
ncbi:tetratricopeptide repeat protein [Robiginitomaculum antarcticum]|uniref:tetratricopeptide repeat protein n=1 Tax=Robiginitomaculum antarcticum TaxID=437507 RepID=UPI00037183EA|nr:hypothetical protein [Robiginitomaculum antarcticum]